MAARRKDRLDALVEEIEGTGGRAFAIEANVTDRSQAAETGAHFGSPPALLDAAPRGKMIRLLLMDDDMVHRRVLILLLETGHPGGSTSRLLAQARQMLEGVDVAILDRRLPDGDGLKLIGELREASPGVKVLVISAYEELVNRREAIEAGAPDRTIRWGSALTLDAYPAGRLLHSGSTSCCIPWSAWKGFLRTSVRSRESFAAPPRLRS